ncbi:hypothetical protein OG612_26630 [Streptomyces sp. NBC_01527]|uniref:hypothetical protein n=1 Tax=unclassified Streptomyces TaxID=2593676 RepID=UPI002E10E70A|nr:hypothetical protein OG763_17015 [Streptomyces sp. NBC_01230]
MDSTERAPAVARSRARLASSVAAFLVLSPFVAWLFALAGLVPAGASVVCALTGGLAGAILLPELCQETGLVRCSMSRVIARTLTGERSVDLTRIRDVRLLTGFGYGGTFRAVVVRDRSGARVGLTTLRSQRALARALQNARADARGGPRVSRAARAHLGLGARHHRTIHTVIIFLVLTISVPLYMGLVLRLAELQ